MATPSTSAPPASRPTFTVGGQDRSQLADGLLTMMVSEHVDGLSRCEATFGNWGDNGGQLTYLYFDRSVLEFGKPFVVKLGADALFDGHVTGLEGQYPPAGRAAEVTVLAEDRLQDLRMTRRTRSFTNVSDGDLARRIAGEYGLSANVGASGGSHVVLTQVNQSDLAFLRERARAIDAEVWVDQGALNFQPRTRRNAGTLTLHYLVELASFSVLADLAHQRTSVNVSGWDVSSKSAITHQAGGSVVSGELNGGDSGASILQSAFGDRKEAITHTVPLNAREAQDRAEAAFRLRARRFITGQGVAATTPSLRVGACVDLQGLGPLFSGKYYVTEVRHLFDGNGLRSEFTAERPGLGKP